MTTSRGELKPAEEPETGREREKKSREVVFAEAKNRANHQEEPQPTIPVLPIDPASWQRRNHWLQQYEGLWGP